MDGASFADVVRDATTKVVVTADSIVAVNVKVEHPKYLNGASSCYFNADEAGATSAFALEHSAADHGSSSSLSWDSFASC
jgi:hypothetical protein